MNITHPSSHVAFTADDDLSFDVVTSSSSSPSQQHNSSSSAALGVTAAACEWVVALIIIAFVASFVVEFGRIRKVHRIRNRIS